MAAAHAEKPYRLMAVVAHPDDEALGLGGTLAKYASEGVETYVVTATRGENGRYRGHRGDEYHPGPQKLAEIRESELRAAASVLGIREVTLLDYPDLGLDRANAREAIAQIAHHLRRTRPDVVLTFPPDGAYGHPDHIAICQYATAAVAAAASPSFPYCAQPNASPHLVKKLYYLAWPQSTWNAYEEAFNSVVFTVDGVQRRAMAWPDWAVTTAIDTRDVWPTVWRAVSCHESQIDGYERLKDLQPQHHEALWGCQYFYRALSIVNGGRTRETDLFEGIRHS
jgi:LmbE family N-acetylglucosaminyl deacetylase